MKTGNTRKLAAMALATALAASTLAGCAAQPSANNGDSPTARPAASSSSSASTSTSEVATADVSGMDRSYTDRDKDATYDESKSTKISLSGATIETTGDGVTVDGTTATITKKGTYIVTGNLADGQLAIDMDKNDKVQLVLAGVDIHNADGPAIYVKQTDKCFITLAASTENVLTDGADYALDADSDEPYATLFSKDDLTINGSGALSVTSSYKHAVCSKDDLVITGGTYRVTAVEDALRGRDCVKILDGVFDIKSGEDGIKSNKDTDATQGSVSLDGGAFTIDASDDAVHAEMALFVEGISMNIVSCTEGYEAEQIYINGGDTRIKASDDAINASAPGVSASGGFGGKADFAGNRPSGDGADGAQPGDQMRKGRMYDDNPAQDDSSAQERGQFKRQRPDGVQAPEGDIHGGGKFRSSAVDAQGEGAVPGAPGTPDGAQPSSGDAQRGGKFRGSGAADAQGNGEVPPAAPDGSDPASVNGDFAGRGGARFGGGMSGASGNCLIQINGGTVILDAEGDGIDSNGRIEITGGNVFVNGPTSSGNGAIDGEFGAEISGGTVVAVGAAGMAEGFSGGDQGSIRANVKGVAGDTVAVMDASGNALVEFTPTKSFGNVVASAPGMAKGATYQLQVGDMVLDCVAG